MKSHSVIIVGAGPAGIFTALSLVKKGINDIIILDMGKDIFSRDRKSGKGGELLSGWGGAGAFSDGKLTFSTEVGGFLSEFIPHKKLVGLLHEADKMYLNYGGPSCVYGEEHDEIDEMKKLAKLAGMELVPMRVRHLGTENCLSILKNIREDLNGKLVVRTESKVKHVLVEENTSKRTVPDIAAYLGAADINSGMPGTFHDIPRNLKGLSIVNVDGIRCPHPRRTQPGPVQVISQYLHVEQMAGAVREGIPPQQTFLDAYAAVIGTVKFAVTHNYIVDAVAGIDCFEKHAIVDVFERAVGNRYVVGRPPDPDTCRIDMFL